MENTFLKFKNVLILFLLALGLSSCSPTIRTNLFNPTTKPQALGPEETVYLVKEEVSLPPNSEYIGELVLGCELLCVDCGFKTMMEIGRTESKKLGANHIKIIDTNNKGTCYEMKAALYYYNEYEDLAQVKRQDETLNIPSSHDSIGSDILITDVFAKDRISIDKSYLVKSMVLKSEWNTKSYEYFKRRAQDEARLLGGNIVKILDYNKREQKSEMQIEIYKVDPDIFDDKKSAYTTFSAVYNKRQNDRSWFSRKVNDEFYLKTAHFENQDKFLYSIPRDSTTDHRIELGLFAGSDVLFLGVNVHTNFEAHLLNTSYAKFSLSNKAGLMLVPIQNYGLWYDAPGIKLSIPFIYGWLTTSYSKEYIRYVGIEDPEIKKTDLIDHRIDIGWKFYKDKRSSLEVYYPLRLDSDVINWWTGGIVAGLNYHF